MKVFPLATAGRFVALPESPNFSDSFLLKKKRFKKPEATSREYFFLSRSLTKVNKHCRILENIIQQCSVSVLHRNNCESLTLPNNCEITVLSITQFSIGSSFRPLNVQRGFFFTTNEFFKKSIFSPNIDWFLHFRYLESCPSTC